VKVAALDFEQLAKGGDNFTLPAMVRPAVTFDR